MTDQDRPPTDREKLEAAHAESARLKAQAKAEGRELFRHPNGLVEGQIIATPLGPVVIGGEGGPS